jgi:hypothetical protein
LSPGKIGISQVQSAAFASLDVDGAKAWKAWDDKANTETVRAKLRRIRGVCGSSQKPQAWRTQMSTKPMKSYLSPLAAIVVMAGLAAAPNLAVAQTTGGAGGTNTGTTTAAPGTATAGTVNTDGDTGWWGLIGLLGLAGLYPMFRGNRTVNTTGAATATNRKL